MARDIFISYSRKDLEAVKAIKDEIEKATGVECWMDLEGIESNNPNFVKAIVAGIVECQVFIFMLSKYSQTSNYALGEIDLAKNESKEIVFVNIDNCTLTREFRLVYGRSNILRWNNQSEHNKLLRDLSRWLKSKSLPNEEVHQESKMTVAKIMEPPNDEEENDMLDSYIKKLSNRNPFAVINKHFWWIIVSLLIVCPLTIKHCLSNRTEYIPESIEEPIIESNQEEDNEEKTFIQSLKQNYISSLPDSCFIPIVRDGLYGFADHNGVLLIPCIWRIALPFTNGLSVVQESNELFGFINKTGNVAIPCLFKGAFPFSEGLARVQDFATSLYGFINCKGDTIVPFQWYLAGDFIEDLAVVQDENELFGYIDQTGKCVIPCLWPSATNFSEGLALVQGQDCKYGYINKSGEIIIPCQWIYAESFNNGKAIVQDEDGRWLTINKLGRIIKEYY